MHQSFVTTAPIGLGNGGDIDFSLCKARVCAQHCRDNFYGQSPAQILVGKCEITPAGLGMESKAPRFHGIAGTMPRSKHGTLAPLFLVTNDWCIICSDTHHSNVFKFSGNYSNFFGCPNIYEFYGRSVWAASRQNQQNGMCALRRFRRDFYLSS